MLKKKSNYVKGRYTPGDKLQQQGEATRRSDKSLRVYWRIFFENLCVRNRILSLQQVAKNQIRLNLCDLLRRQNSVAGKDFHKNSPVHTKRFVAATCRRDMLLQLVA